MSSHWLVRFRCVERIGTQSILQQRRPVAWRWAGVSGRGLLLGLHLDRPAAEVQRELFGRRIITGTAADPAVLRLLPPLSFSAREADLLLAGLAEVLR